MNGALGSWIDGRPADLLPADDRGLHYGDGVFETILARDGRARFLDAHLARLAKGCQRLAITLPATLELRAEIDAAIAAAPSLAMLKLIVTRGSAQRRGYAPAGTETARRIISLWPASATDVSRERGVDLRVAKITLGVNPALAGIKHLNRLENILAAAESPNEGAFDSLLLDTSGNLVSGAMCNVFLARGGRLATPAIDRCGVAGVMRGIVLRECAALAIEAVETRLTLDDLYAADEAFVTNARIGVVPVRRVGEHAFAMNTLASRLSAHVDSLDA